MIFRIASLVAEKAAARYPNDKEKADNAAAFWGVATFAGVILLMLLVVSALLYAGRHVFEDANARAKRQAIESSTKEISYQQARIPGLLAKETSARTALEEASAIASEALAKSARARECLDANSGTGLAVDCATMTGTLVVPLGDKFSDKDDKEAVSIVDDIFPKANASTSSGSDTSFVVEPPTLFLSYGHGLHENGKWNDDGAIAADKTTERSVIMAIGDTVYNHALKEAKLGYTPVQVGRDRHTMKENIKFASDKALELGCAAYDNCYLVSIHANSSVDTSKSGTVVYYNPYAEPSMRLAHAVAACTGGKALSDEQNRYGRLGILRDVENVNGILIETGYLTNPGDLELLKSGKAGSALAKCVVSSINSL